MFLKENYIRNTLLINKKIKIIVEICKYSY